MPRPINAGTNKIVVWGLPDATLAGSALDAGTTTVYEFGDSSIASFRAGRNPALNSLTTIRRWRGYQVSAVGATVQMPDETLGFGNTPAGGGGSPSPSPTPTPVGRDFDINLATFSGILSNPDWALSSNLGGQPTETGGVLRLLNANGGDYGLAIYNQPLTFADRTNFWMSIKCTMNLSGTALATFFREGFSFVIHNTANPTFTQPNESAGTGGINPSLSLAFLPSIGRIRALRAGESFNYQDEFAGLTEADMKGTNTFWIDIERLNSVQTLKLYRSRTTTKPGTALYELNLTSYYSLTNLFQTTSTLRFAMGAQARFNGEDGPGTKIFDYNSLRIAGDSGSNKEALPAL